MTDADHGGEPMQPGPSDGDTAPEEDKWPIGFILTIVLVAVYLGYRLIQGIVLFIDWIF